MKKLYVTLILGLFLIQSCQKDDLTQSERRTIGSWEYEQVKYNEAGSFGAEDISNEYEGIQIDFFDDFTFEMQNDVIGTTYGGVWEINTDFVNEAYNEKLIGSYTDNASGEVFTLLFENFSVNNRRIWADYNDKKGFFYYKLRKL